MKKSELKELIREVVEETQSLEKAIGYKEPYAVGIAQKLKIENEKLRAALQEIIELAEQESVQSYGFGEIARKALSQ
jgi:DNA-directed RNA polymerase specialized sigma subunit